NGGGGNPPKAKRRADRVADRALLQSLAAGPGELEVLPCAVHHDPIPARTVRVAHRESGERGGPAALGCEIQPQLAGDLVQHNVGLEQLDPGIRLEQLIGTDRPPAGAAPRLARLDPDRRLYLVA